MNSTHYNIYNKDKKKVGEHSQHPMCKTHWADLMEFEPLEEHTIVSWGFDENDERWYGEKENLLDFLKERYKTTVWLFHNKDRNPERVFKGEFYPKDEDKKKQLVRDFLQKYFQVNFHK